jgi:3,4-dihydroxy 2-butanone 4-phosphate synthase / GTP cyclohydrolase II
MALHPTPPALSMTDSHAAQHPAAAPDEPSPFDTVEAALEALRRGELIIVADDEDRENEGDLVGVAEQITTEQINFMTQHARGLICLAMDGKLCDQLHLHQMVSHNEELMQTAFTISVDGHPKYGVTTGISAWDRAKTIQLAVADGAVPGDLRRPGHIFPLRARPGGVLERVGQTEASVDLARLAGFKGAGVICEILNEDGSMARRNELVAYAKQHRLKFITVAQLVAYRLRQERMIDRVSEARLPTVFGEFKVFGYRNVLDNSEHLALVMGDDLTTPPAGTGEATASSTNKPAPLVRVHSECLTGDLLGSLRCDCGFQLHGALQQIAETGRGVLVYLRQHEGRGIGLLNKLKAYSLQDEGLDTVEANHKLGFKADLRQYGVGAQILLDLGITEFRLLTNNPRKIRGLEGYGLKMTDRLALITQPTSDNQLYLATKQAKLGHLLSAVSDQAVSPTSDPLFDR